MKRKKISQGFKLSLSHALLLFLALSVAAYVLTQNVVFAFVSFALIIGLFISDFSPDQGLKQNAFELAYAVGFAVAAWFLLGLVLQTDSPINVVTSCSMLPELQRGDLVFIKGGVEKVESVKASFEDLRSVFVPDGVCYRNSRPVLCSNTLVIANQTIAFSKSNDVIVFDPKPSGPGLIIHRAFAKAETEKGVFYFTMGDNNEFFDQTRFSVVSEKDVKGRVVFKIPFVGYLKLFLFMQFNVPAGCDSTLSRALS